MWLTTKILSYLIPQIAICSPSAVGYEVLKLLHVIKYVSDRHSLSDLHLPLFI